MAAETRENSKSDSDPYENLRRLEPDQFHSMVKMHLSFLLDLNTDDCDCSFIYENHKNEDGASSGDYVCGL